METRSLPDRYPATNAMLGIVGDAKMTWIAVALTEGADSFTKIHDAVGCHAPALATRLNTLKHVGYVEHVGRVYTLTAAGLKAASLGYRAVETCGEAE